MECQNLPKRNILWVVDYIDIQHNYYKNKKSYWSKGNSKAKTKKNRVFWVYFKFRLNLLVVGLLVLVATSKYSSAKLYGDGRRRALELWM
jgi:hypothetical protein